jgi:glycosyltransferase involved in cell wall biosynthesis
VAVLEHFWTAAYWAELAPCTDQVVLDLHNVESALYQTYAATARRRDRWMFRRFHEACLARERKWLPLFDLLLAASDNDAKRLNGVSPASRVEVVPNTIPFVPLPDGPEDHAIVFSGNLRYRPNLEAARFFREQVWPTLREKWPALVWRVVGKNPEAVRRFIDGDDRIQLVGPVEDAVGVLARAQVAVAPILAGSGTRVKILEAWAAGRAVVSTSLGAEGLGAEHARHLLIADGNRDFAEAVSSLLESNSLREQLGRCGRNLFETSFTWGAAWSRLEEIGI